MSSSDFYVGYESRAPRSLTRFVRGVVALLILGGLLMAVVLAWAQQPFDPGTFEFGQIRQFEGVLLEDPIPVLVVERPEHYGLDRGSSPRLLLVSRGKFGAARLVAGMNGTRMVVTGTLIHRGTDAMIELVPGSIQPAHAGTRAEAGGVLDLGRHTLEGEIVDSKCYLGVMKPGRKKTHRACAARCISGGIPPILRVETDSGKPLHLVLVGLDGSSINEQILTYVAEPVSITGRVGRIGEQWVLYADPSSIRRLTG